MGGPAWQFKKFADTSSKPWFSLAWNDKIAGGFINSGALNGDKFPQSNISGRCPNSTARSGLVLGGCPPTPRRMAPTTSTGQVDMQVRLPFHRLTPRPRRRRAAAKL